jgi:hypothetical protein
VALVVLSGVGGGGEKKASRNGFPLPLLCWEGQGAIEEGKIPESD